MYISINYIMQLLSVMYSNRCLFLTSVLVGNASCPMTIGPFKQLLNYPEKLTNLILQGRDKSKAVGI